MKRTVSILPFLLLFSTAFSQDVKFGENPFGDASDESGAKTEWTPTHPDGETPQERMLSLAHTDALPRFDRAELFAVSLPDPKGNERPKKQPDDTTFPVRPYGVYADVHGHVTLTGNDCESLRSAWRSLAFDRLGGAFCHFPAYGIRLYRNDQLLFETTVCWQCQNFYVPRYDNNKRRVSYGWYGFANDENAKALLKLLRSHLNHPKLTK